MKAASCGLYSHQGPANAGDHRAPGPEAERQNIKLTIDHEADALYLELDEAAATESEELSPGVILDFNAEGRVVGVEMLNLSKRVSSQKLARVELETVGA